MRRAESFKGKIPDLFKEIKDSGEFTTPVSLSGDLYRFLSQGSITGPAAAGFALNLLTMRLPKERSLKSFKFGAWYIGAASNLISFPAFRAYIGTTAGPKVHQSISSSQFPFIVGGLADDQTATVAGRSENGEITTYYDKGQIVFPAYNLVGASLFITVLSYGALAAGESAIFTGEFSFHE